MAAGALQVLPLEIIHTIASLSPTSHLRSIALANKSCNEVFTPILYSEIVLRDYPTAELCVATLSIPTQHTYGRRDLALLIRKFSYNPGQASVTLKYGIRGDRDLYLKRLEDAISCMTQLQHFTFYTAEHFTPKICHSVFSAASQTLQSFFASIFYEWNENEPTLDKLLLFCPGLSTVEIDFFCPVSGSPLEFLRRLILSHAYQLRVLSLRIAEYGEICSMLPTLPKLEKLVVTILAFQGGVPPFHAPALRSLVIYGQIEILALVADGLGEHRPQIPSPGTFPILEELTCAPEVLSMFLPENSEAKRPIRKVELNGAVPSGKNTTMFNEVAEIGYGYPPWDAIRDALTYLPHSLTPIRELAFTVSHLDLVQFAMEAQAYVPPLESLCITVARDPINDLALASLGETLFVHMPLLHKFVLEIGQYNERAHDPSFLLSWAERWQVHAPALRTVAFTDTLRCERGVDGWSVRTVP
ncbi:hypothetical protein C8Q77DRAFT_481807 [Trametes polyzona]|nr:hypothetical protein C8Q77DRAFT_481807 [Trametes polyzona]